MRVFTSSGTPPGRHAQCSTARRVKFVRGGCITHVVADGTGDGYVEEHCQTEAQEGAHGRYIMVVPLTDVFQRIRFLERTADESDMVLTLDTKTSSSPSWAEEVSVEGRNMGGRIVASVSTKLHKPF